MVSSMSATSNLYDVLKRVDWLAIFSPWAIINRSKMYAMTTKQNTCATRTPATNVALKDFLRRAPLRSGLAIVRGSTTVLPNIFMVRRAHHDIKPNTYATRTPANNAALKGLAIAKGGTTVVPNIFSGEFMEDGSFLSASMSSLRSVWTLLRSNCEAIIHANEKPTIMDNVSCQSGIEDGKPVRRKRRGNELNRFHTPFPSILHLLLSTIFVLLNFCFISATHAQSQTHESGGGAAEVVKGLMVGQKVPEEFWTYKHLLYTDGDTIRKDLSEYKGKLLVLDLWATWCAICLAQMSEKQLLFSKYPDETAFLLVNSVRTKDTYETILTRSDKISSSTLGG